MVNYTPPVTLQQFILDREKDFPYATGELSRLIRDVSLAARIVNREVNRAGLVDVLGDTGTVNIQEEPQKKLDVFADRHFIRSFTMGKLVAALASEEHENIIPVNTATGKYVVLIDPLDGSSNIDTNIPVGTIFSIYRVKNEGGLRGTVDDCLQPGSKQVAAGYVIYGSSTILVYTTGQGVNGFTLDPSLGEFFLSHPDMQLPAKAQYFSMNDAKYNDFTPGIRAYLEYIRNRNQSKTDALTPRYVGSLVADFHRNLLKGGIFLYPGTITNPNGKLRLLYEANPMAFIITQAGGVATNGIEPILNLVPLSLHQRTPLFIGPKAEIEVLHKHLSEQPAFVS